MGRFACCVSRETVVCSQSNSALPVCPLTSWTPVARFAIHRDIWSEMNAPPMPQTKLKMASDWMFRLPSGSM
jgi:hypothetical protein